MAIFRITDILVGWFKCFPNAKIKDFVFRNVGQCHVILVTNYSLTLHNYVSHTKVRFSNHYTATVPHNIRTQ